jgi:hypothetical protein
MTTEWLLWSWIRSSISTTLFNSTPSFAERTHRTLRGFLSIPMEYITSSDMSFSARVRVSREVGKASCRRVWVRSTISEADVVWNQWSCLSWVYKYWYVSVHVDTICTGYLGKDARFLDGGKYPVGSVFVRVEFANVKLCFHLCESVSGLFLPNWLWSTDAMCWYDDARGVSPYLLSPAIWQSSAWLLTVKFGGWLFSSCDSSPV